MSFLPPNLIISPEYKKVTELATTVGAITLVSGEAGTGKSVLIDYLSQTFKHLNVIKIAPTGVAGINIDGATIHSTFQLPLGVLTPKVIKQHCQQLALTSRKMRAFCKSIHILILDEISMVRADVLDAIDEILRKFTGNNMPFGGIITIMVGDLLQLSPIVREDDEEEFNSCNYDSPYFFSSRVIQSLLFFNKLHCVKLSTVRRQNDETFLSLLKNIRNREKVDVTVKVINGVCYDNKPKVFDRTTVTLCSTNAMTSLINQTELDNLNSEIKTYEATLYGKFRRDSVLSPDTLELKVGARVMFTKNHADGLWVNGTLGTIQSFNSMNHPSVLIDGESSPISVDWEVWENCKYTVARSKSTNDDDDEVLPINKEVLGSFTQIPLMLAWAITIHKVQGLTFDKVIINLGRGAFAAGQLYVAFSRCRTIHGISLENPIKHSDFITDYRVVKFCNELPYIQVDQDLVSETNTNHTCDMDDDEPPFDVD